MAEVTITVDTTRANVKLDHIPVAVRGRMRSVLPSLIRRLASVVNVKLRTQLKTTNTLTVAQEMHEDSSQLYGVVRLDSPSAGGLLPEYLEKGTIPHTITGNPVLAFQWDFMGAYGGSVSGNTTMAFFRRVRHPGTRAYKFMENTLAEQQAGIVQELTAAIKGAARGAG